MALLKFVKNVKDLSKDGGYQFRFCCDKCGDGFDSEFVTSSANLLKTGLEIFSIFKPGWGTGRVADTIDRGLSGKEHDAAYERAVQQAMTFFRKCTRCGSWVCPENCWNDEAGMCEGCAPSAEEAAAHAGAAKRVATAVSRVQTGESAGSGLVSCPACRKMAKPGKFCSHCGCSLQALSCKKCLASLSATDRFCAACGTSVK